MGNVVEYTQTSKEKEQHAMSGDVFDDYMDYKLSGNGSGQGYGDFGGCLPWVLGVLIVLWLISKLLF